MLASTLSDPRASRIPWPDLLSGLRLALVPVLGALAWQGLTGPFLGALVVALASDALDGFLARRLRCESERGAKLDSRADLAFWLAMPPCLLALRPDLVQAALPEIVVLGACLVVPTLAGLARFGRLTSYHTWGAKLTAVVMAATLLALFAGAPPALLRAAAAVAVLSQLEELVITAILPAWRADVRSVVHAWRIARYGAEESEPEAR